MTTKDSMRIARAIKAKKEGDWNFSDCVYERHEWKSAAFGGDTQLGYFDWVIHQIEGAYSHGE